MVRGLPSKTCRRIFDAFVIEARAYAIVSCFMSSKRRNQLRRVFETTKARSIEIDMLNVCLSKCSPCRLGRLTFEIRRAAPVVVHFVIRLRKSSRLNQFVAPAYSRRCRKTYDVRARNLGSFNIREFLLYPVLLQAPLTLFNNEKQVIKRCSVSNYFYLGSERVVNNE